MSLIIVAGLSSSVFVTFYTFRLDAFAQNSGSIASEISDQPLIDQLAIRIQNKTGGENASVKPILEQIAMQILNKHGNITLHNILVNFTTAVKRPGSDVVSQSIYGIASNEAIGNASSVNQAISQLTQEIGKGRDPKQVLLETTIQLIGGPTLNQKIDHIAGEVENGTGYDHVLVKKTLEALILRIANVRTGDAAKNIINQIVAELKMDPNRPIS